VKAQASGPAAVCHPGVSKVNVNANILRDRSVTEWVWTVGLRNSAERSRRFVEVVRFFRDVQAVARVWLSDVGANLASVQVTARV